MADKAHNYLLAYLEDRLQSRIEMGRPKIGWLRGSWYIKDVSIWPRHGKEKLEFVKAKSVRISFFPWWNVLNREIAISSIQVDEPALYFRIEKGKIANLPSFDFLKGQGHGNGKGLFKFKLNEVIVNNGTLKSSYDSGEREYAFEKIDMKIVPEFDKEHFTFLLSNSSAAVRIKDFYYKIPSAHAKILITQNTMRITDALFSMPEGKVSAEEFAIDFDTVKWSLKAVSNIDLAPLKALIYKQPFAKPFKEIALKGKADLSATIQGHKEGFEIKGEARAGEFQLDGTGIRETSANFSTRGRWSSMKESEFVLEVRSKVPVELARHYYESVPEMKGVADIHFKCSVADGQWSAGRKNLKIEGDAASQHVEARDLPADNISLKFAADKDGVRIKDMVADISGGSLTGSGGVELTGDKRFEGSIVLKDLKLNKLGKALPMNGSAVNGTASGNIDFTGSMSPGPQMESRSTLNIQDLALSRGTSFAARLPSVHVKSRISYANMVAMIKSVEIETPSSAATVSGEISDRQMALDLNVDSADLKELTGYVGGSGGFKGKISGKIGDPAVVGNLNLSKVIWSGYHADLISGNVGFKESTLSSTGLMVRHGNSEVSLSGELSFSKESPWLNAVIEMEKGRLDDISSMTGIDIPAKGNVSLYGKVKGDIRSLNGEMNIEGTGMTVAGEEIDLLSISGNMENGRLLLQRTEILRGADRVAIYGSIDAHGEMHLAVSSSPLTLGNLSFIRDNNIPVKGTLEFNGELTGDMRNPSFNGRGIFKDAGYGVIDLGSGTLGISMTDKMLNLSGDLFGLDINGTVLLKGNNPFHASIGAKEASLTRYFKGNPGLEGLTGVLSGTLNAEGELSNIGNMSAKAYISRLQLVREPFVLKNGKDIKVELRNGRMVFNSFQLIGNGTELNTSGWMGLDGESNIVIAGNLDLFLLQIFTKVVGKGEGVVDIKLGISGKPSRVEGAISLRNGVIGLKGFEPVFRDISGTASLKGGTLLIETLGGRVGEGRFKGEGSIQMEGVALKRTDILFDLSGVRLAYPKWLPSEVEGSLRLSGEYPLLLLSGDINIVKARYSERVDWATLLPSLKQRLKEPAARKEGETTLMLDINIKADRNIIFENNVGKGELKGNLRLKGDAGGIGMVGNVEMITGKVFYKEHEFVITSGVIEFPDPKKIEAVFDFSAEGKVRDYTIQILVQGNINDLKVTMTSTPSLSDLDIASLLSFGLTSKEFMATGAGAPAYEAASFVSREMEGKFKDYVGFDRFHIDPYYSKATGTTEPKLTVGKDISEDVMLIYSRSLSSAGEQEAQMEYKLYKNLSVIGGWSSFGASRQGDLGADMKFRFEFR